MVLHVFYYEVNESELAHSTNDKPPCYFKNVFIWKVYNPNNKNALTVDILYVLSHRHMELWGYLV
jgi:hypothetical protein